LKAPLLVGTIALSMLLGGCASQPATPIAPSEGIASEPTTDPIPVNTATPSKTPISGPLATVEIEANQSDEEMAQDLLASFASWHMAGATPEAKAVRSSQYGSITLEAYAQKIADEQVVNFAPKLFGKDYASNALLSNTANGYTKSNKLNVLAYLQTSGTSNPANKEPYTRSLVLDDFESLPTAGADKSLSINYHEVDNSDKNIIGEGGISEVHGHKGTMTLSLKNANGSMIITLMKDIER
jgi:hypothetical protein